MIKQAIKNWLARKGYTIIKTTPEEVDRMVPAQLPQHLFSNSRVYSCREDALTIIPKNGVIAEVGVAYGNFSSLLLEQLQPQKFIAIDSFDIAIGNEPWKQTVLRDSGLSHLEYYKKKFSKEIEIGQLEVHKGLSWDCLAKIPDHSLDYLYLDAGHSYEEVKKDIAALKSKMKDQGIIQFNDYTLLDTFALIPYGVPKAVHEFLLEEKYDVIGLALHRQFFSDLIVRKR